MNTEDLRAAVLAAVAAIAPEADLSSIRPDRPLRAQIALDSLDWVNVAARLHEQLSIDLPAADLGPLATVDSIVAALAARGAGHRAAPPARPASAPPPSAPPASAPLPTLACRVQGRPVELRPIGPDDLTREADFVRHLSLESRYKRFMVTLHELPKAKLKYLTEVDQVRHVALAAIAERDGGPALVGVARYIVDDAGTGCEFALAVDDDWQGTGLAGVLMQALIDVARARGLKSMEGSVLAVNTRMLRFARQLGFVQQRDPDDRDTVRVLRRL